MNTRLKQQIYESVMKAISKNVKKALNEKFDSNFIKQCHDKGYQIYYKYENNKHAKLNLASVNDNDYILLEVGKSYSIDDLKRQEKNNYVLQQLLRITSYDRYYIFALGRNVGNWTPEAGLRQFKLEDDKLTYTEFNKEWQATIDLSDNSFEFNYIKYKCFNGTMNAGNIIVEISKDGEYTNYVLLFKDESYMRYNDGLSKEESDDNRARYKRLYDIHPNNLNKPQYSLDSDGKILDRFITPDELNRHVAIIWDNPEYDSETKQYKIDKFFDTKFKNKEDLLRYLKAFDNMILRRFENDKRDVEIKAKKYGIRNNIKLEISKQLPSLILKYMKSKHPDIIIK